MKGPNEHPAIIDLCDQNLARLPNEVITPSYDRNKITPGIVHIGLGNFHRAHQSWYLHRLMQQGLAMDWGIVGAGVLSNDAEMRKKLLRQDCLTTLVELDPQSATVEVIGPMIDFVEVTADHAPLIKAMSDPRIRIVSLTVTEGGYFLAEDGSLDTKHPDIIKDAANPDRPTTAFGAIVAALKLRRENGIQPFAGQSCDNLQNNGDVLRQTIVGLAALSDQTLADWIDVNASFPNAMVDCIVPATGDAERAFVQGIGIGDQAPVTHENYRQWVLQDDFCSGRPPWEKAGATITDDVHLYERMKIRVLNAGHQMLANIGEVLGLQTISDCMRHPQIAVFFRKVQLEEVVPYVDPVKDVTPQNYLNQIEQRFLNPKIRDTTRRVAFDGSSRHPGFVLPIVRDALALGGSISGLALVEALWARMCAGQREDESEIAANDPNWEILHDLANQAKTDPKIWLAQENLYGDLAQNEVFRSEFSMWLLRIWQSGTQDAVRAYIES